RSSCRWDCDRGATSSRACGRRTSVRRRPRCARPRERRNSSAWPCPRPPPSFPPQRHQIRPGHSWCFKTMHPRGFGPRSLVAIENGMAKAAPTLGRLFVLLVVVDLGEFRVADISVLPAGAVAGGRGVAGTTRGGTFLGLLVHRLAELHRGLRQRIGLGRDRRGVVALERFLEVGHRILDRAPIAL